MQELQSLVVTVWVFANGCALFNVSFCCFDRSGASFVVGIFDACAVNLLESSIVCDAMAAYLRSVRRRYLLLLLY